MAGQARACPASYARNRPSGPRIPKCSEESSLHLGMPDPIVDPHLFPPGAHENHVRPLGGEKVHWTFSCFRLAPLHQGEEPGW